MSTKNNIPETAKVVWRILKTKGMFLLILQTALLLWELCI